ncbi:MAG: hypothetical protein V7L13_05275 [Nostoc sp.]|uniref:hypothetical protein n=1 Tax=Nostoc sp. TaxID=1180 RepID=UPI002FFC165D
MSNLFLQESEAEKTSLNVVRRRYLDHRGEDDVLYHVRLISYNSRICAKTRKPSFPLPP